MNASASIRRAVIDVGTNSIKLLVAEISGEDVVPLLETSRQTRLGAGFYATRILQRAAILQTAEAAAEFARQAKELGAVFTRVIATSAARDARNAADLTTAIEQSCGLPTEIISGDKEADWVFRGVTSNPALAGGPVLVLDVGGGSTEFIVGDKGVPQFRSSHSLGTVRLLEQLRPSDPPGLRALLECRSWLRDFLRKEVLALLKPALTACRGGVKLVAAGGSATVLARIAGALDNYNRAKIESTTVPLEGLRELVERHWQMTLAERQAVVGVPPKRADVTLTGLVIHESIMEQLGFSRLFITTRGLRFWAVRHG